MVFYNEKGDKLRLDLDKDKYMYGDVNGNIYFTHNGMFVKDIFSASKEDLELIALMKKLKLKNFCEIHDLIFDVYGVYKGYSMKGCNREDLNLLTMPVSYIIDNLSNIYNSILTLSCNKIHANGLLSSNTIINSDGITIFNVDLYRICENIPGSLLIKENTLLLRTLFNDILSESVYKYNLDDSYNYINIIKKLCIKMNCSGINGFERELNGYKYPIDYIKKKCRK